MNGEDKYLIFEKIFEDENFELDPEKETNESVEQLKYPHEHNSDYPTVNNLDDLNEEGTKYFKQFFERSTHSNISILKFSQDY